MKTLVVVPTYDERPNLERLVSGILAQAHDLELLIIDDASPDGTGALADALAAADPRIHVMHRAGKLGQGSAYVEGFRWMFAKTDAAYVVQMDADLSHDPAALPALFAAMDDSDLAVGSRYCDGIRVLNWPWQRLALSLAANRYAGLVSGVPIRDLTAGYKCYRRSSLERIGIDAIQSSGYAFHIETTVRAWQLGLRVREIPIVFSDRVEGESKLSKRIVWEAAWVVWALRFTAARRRRAARGTAERE